MNKRELKKELKAVLNTNIEKRVLKIVWNRAVETLEYNNNNFIEALKNTFKDYAHGCSTGIIYEVVYYNDTTKIFNYYKKDIMYLMNDYILQGYFNIYEDIKAFNYDGITFLLNNNNQLENKRFNINEKNSIVWLIYDLTIQMLYDKFLELID